MELRHERSARCTDGRRSGFPTVTVADRANAPAVQTVVLLQRATIARPRCYAEPVAVRADAHGCRRRHGCAVSELKVLVRPPTVQRACGFDAAGVARARRDILPVAVRAYGHR